MKTLYLAWQDERETSRRWFPIGRLLADLQGHRYQFDYTKGVREAMEQSDFRILDAFPKLEEHYISSELFPLFQNRVMRKEREDYPALVERLGLPKGEVDPFEILAITGGHRQTDSLEVFPKIQKQADGRFMCRFFLHGWRYANPAAQDRLQRLEAGEPLRVAMELNNPSTGRAIQFETTDYHMIGWSPRYLVDDIGKAIDEQAAAIQAHVVRVNPAPAPHNQRVLVELQGRFPEGLEPMSADEFQPLLPP